jgi:hypothetical protein
MLLQSLRLCVSLLTVLPHQLPCFFVLLEGFLLWINFHLLDGAFVHMPLLLIGITIGILFFPARILYPRTRKWWAYSNVSFFVRRSWPTPI